MKQVIRLYDWSPVCPGTKMLNGLAYTLTLTVK